jgi:protein SCO1/2
MFKPIVTATALVCSLALAFAQGMTNDLAGPDVAAGAAAQNQTRNFNRDVLARMGVDQKEGAQVPADVPFTDEHGRQIKFGDLYGKRPIVIMPMFFTCQGVCSVETDSLLQTIIQIQELSVGKDYDVVMLSINPKETPEITLPKWKVAVETYGRPSGDMGFHFLTGTYENIRRVTDALGFKWVYDAKEGTINHPAGLMTLSPEGKITGYLINKEFPRAFLLKMIDDAKSSKISEKNETILFGCIMIDHATKRKSLVIENVIRLFAAVFAVGLAGWIVGMSVSGRHRKASEVSSNLS